MATIHLQVCVHICMFSQANNCRAIFLSPILYIHSIKKSCWLYHQNAQKSRGFSTTLSSVSSLLHERNISQQFYFHSYLLPPQEILLIVSRFYQPSVQNSNGFPSHSEQCQYLYIDLQGSKSSCLWVSLYSHIITLLASWPHRLSLLVLKHTTVLLPQGFCTSRLLILKCFWNVLLPDIHRNCFLYLCLNAILSERLPIGTLSWKCP